MGDEWPDAHHMGLQLLDKEQILRQVLRRLEGGAHHEAAAGLEAQGFQSFRQPMRCSKDIPGGWSFS